MQQIIRDCPVYADRDHPLTLPDGHVLPGSADRMIVWVSLTPPLRGDGASKAGRSSRRFPAVVDTGCNRSLIINDRQLSELAGTPQAYFPKTLRADGKETDRIRNKECSLRKAILWIHVNKSGFRDQLTDDRPFRCDLFPGMTVTPDTMDFPELPLIGIPTLLTCRLDLWLHSSQKCFSLYQRTA